MKPSLIILVAAFAATLFLVAPAAAACPKDSVLVGRTCVDKFEASVWDLSAVAANKKGALIKKIKAGTATEASLLAAGAVQLGVSSDDYPCNDDGNDCTNIYAVSIPSVTPAAFITWFQAQQAATNSGKRLLTNAEWQAAAAGTSDPGDTPGASDCNTTSSGPVDTGSRSNCKSRFGVFDMVGNLWEWVADWVPSVSGSCGSALFAGDNNCLAGTAQAAGTSALLRGGRFASGTGAGVFAVAGSDTPSDADDSFGFRAAR